MRSLPDRIRHAISFELIALLLVTPLGALIFQLPIQIMGVVTVVSATLATLWNLIFDYAFDAGLKAWVGSTKKTHGMRILHTVLFEIGLLMVLMPFIAWYLGISLWQAFVMDASFALFYMVYAYVFNLTYDRMFPLPEWAVVPDAD